MVRKLISLLVLIGLALSAQGCLVPGFSYGGYRSWGGYGAGNYGGYAPAVQYAPNGTPYVPGGYTGLAAQQAWQSNYYRTAPMYTPAYTPAVYYAPPQSGGYYRPPVTIVQPVYRGGGGGGAPCHGGGYRR